MKLRNVICVLSVLAVVSTTMLSPGPANGQQQDSTAKEPTAIQKLLKNRDRTPDPDGLNTPKSQLKLPCIPGEPGCLRDAGPLNNSSPNLSRSSSKRSTAERRQYQYCAREEPTFPCWRVFDLDETADGRIFFESGSANLGADAQGLWRDIGAELAKDGVTQVKLVGHTDAIGSDRYNLALSKQRARTVRAILREELPGVRISADGRGERELADPQNEGSAVNRRVVMEYLRTK